MNTEAASITRDGGIQPPDELSSYFHMVNRLLPAGQELLTVSPEMTAREALRIMRDRGYSQLPVREGEALLGIFSFRGFALEVERIGRPNTDVGELPVEEFLSHEEPTYARLTDEFRGLIDELDRRDSVIVSGPDNLVAIVTPMDVLRYLYSVANAFVLLEEIELALRALIIAATGEGARLQTCIANALSSKYQENGLPETVEEMTFDDYIGLLRDGRNWEQFRPVFGGTRERLRGRLEPVRDLRNEIFHFRRELSTEDHERLTTCRDWLLRCVRKVRAREGR